MDVHACARPPRSLICLLRGPILAIRFNKQNRWRRSRRPPALLVLLELLNSFSMTSPISIQELKARVLAGSVSATVFGQVETVTEKQTRDQKPYFELVVRDVVGTLTIRVWNDHPAFDFCAGITAGASVCIEGEFWSGNSYGIEVRNWQIRDLTVEEKAVLFEGPEELR